VNINNVWECDLVDDNGISKYNDGDIYLLTVIDVFSKFIHIIPLLTKTGKAVTTAFQSIFKDPKYLKPIRRHPVWVRTVRGKEFLDKLFQGISGINYTNTSHKRTRTDLSTYSRNL